MRLNIKANSKNETKVTNSSTKAAPIIDDVIEDAVVINDAPAPAKKKVPAKKKAAPKAKAKVSASPKVTRNLKVESYTTKKGAEARRIVGFKADDPYWMNAKSYHGTGVSFRTIDGDKICVVLLGANYNGVAKQLCDAFNSGNKKDVDKAIAAAHAVYKSVVEASKAAKSDEPKNVRKTEGNEPTYTASEVAEMIRKAAVGKELPKPVMDCLNAA